MTFRQPPRADYSEQVNALIALFNDALIQTRDVLDSPYTENRITRAVLTARLKQIDAILAQLNEQGIAWADEALTVAAMHGTADVIYSGGDMSYGEALAVATLSTTNKAYVYAQTLEMQDDILAITQNMSKQAKLFVTQTFSTKLREQLVSGNNNAKTLKSAVTRRLSDDKTLFIRDAAGRRWKIRDYVDMIVQTKMMTAHKTASINAGLESKMQYGRISRHYATDDCAKWEGKIVKLDASAPGEYPTLDDLPSREIFHPRCRHVVTPIYLQDA